MFDLLVERAFPLHDFSEAILEPRLTIEAANGRAFRLLPIFLVFARLVCIQHNREMYRKQQGVEDEATLTPTIYGFKKIETKRPTRTATAG